MGVEIPFTMGSFLFQGNTDAAVIDAVFWIGSVPPDGTLLTVVSETNPAGAGAPTFADITCFDAMAEIETLSGTKCACDLQVGDQPVSVTDQNQKIIWISRRIITPCEMLHNPKLQPVRIAANAFGEGYPSKDLIVSQEHRVLLSSKITQRMFGCGVVMVAAKFLTNLLGVEIFMPETPMTYVHFLLENHSAVQAHNIWAESLYLGPVVFDNLDLPTRRSLCACIAQYNLKSETSDFKLLGRQKAQNLLERHIKNQKPVFDPVCAEAARDKIGSQPQLDLAG